MRIENHHIDHVEKKNEIVISRASSGADHVEKVAGGLLSLSHKGDRKRGRELLGGGQVEQAHSRLQQELRLSQENAAKLQKELQESKRKEAELQDEYYYLKQRLTIAQAEKKFEKFFK